MKIYMSLCAVLALSGTLLATEPSPEKATPPKNPTVITAGTFVFDGIANRADLIKDVYIDDDDVAIRCDKMEIYLRSDSEIKSADASTDTGIKQSENLTGAFAFSGEGKVDRIECIGNVFITRKSMDENGNVKNDQRCTSGHATYYVPTEKIVLTEKPIVYAGKDKMAGRVITIFRNSSKVIVKDVVITGEKPQENTAKPRTQLREGN